MKFSIDHLQHAEADDDFDCDYDYDSERDDYEEFAEIAELYNEIMAYVNDKMIPVCENFTLDDLIAISSTELRPKRRMRYFGTHIRGGRATSPAPNLEDLCAHIMAQRSQYLTLENLNEFCKVAQKLPRRF